MAQDQVEEIKRKIDIVDLISEHVDLKRSGRNFKALCPFHSEKTPSFMVSPELGIFKCFGCGLGGDAYRFLQEYEKVDFPQALKILADRANVKLKPIRGWKGFQEKEEFYKTNYLASEFYHYLLTRHEVGEKARVYLKKRGLTGETIDIFKLGYAPEKPDALSRFLEKKGRKREILQKGGLSIEKQGRAFDRFRGRVIFPLHDHYGNVLGFSGRVIEEKGELAKYINTPDTPVYKKGRHLYGLHITKQDIKDLGFAVLVEGELDALSSWQAGVRNVAAIKGSSLTEDQASLIARFCSQVRLATDADVAGEEAARRAIAQAELEGLTIRVVKLEGRKDPDEAAQKDPGYWKKAIDEAKDVYDFLIDEAFERHDPATTEGKTKISRELGPIFSRIEDEIVKAHLLKKVAARLGVPEEAVFSQIQKKARTASPAKREEQKPAPAKSRRDLLEEYTLALAFQIDAKALEEEELISLFRGPSAVKLVKKWSKWKKKREFDPSKFAQALPGELVDLFARLVLVELGKSFSDPEEFKKEIRRAKKELEILNIKEEMQVLSARMKELESEGSLRLLKKLEKEFSKTGEKLSVLEAS